MVKKSLIPKLKGLIRPFKNFFQRLPRSGLFIASYLLVVALLSGAFYWRTLNRPGFKIYPYEQSQNQQEQEGKTAPSAEPAEESEDGKRGLEEEVLQGQPPASTAAEDAPGGEAELTGEAAESQAEEDRAESRAGQEAAEEEKAAAVVTALSSPPADPLPNWQVARPFGAYMVEKLPTGYKVHRLTRGVDLAAMDSAPVSALWEGRVQKINERDPLFGKSVLLSHEGGGLSFYGNLGEIWVKEGQQVTRGEHLGKLYPAPEKGGNSFLYLEVSKEGKRIDPLDLLEGVARH
ncbi:MAG: M23 family metallopeptidase [Firmicutes bacterium]|nr:M23 family metallopeptidase [Bacillota bacterium]